MHINCEVIIISMQGDNDMLGKWIKTAKEKGEKTTGKLRQNKTKSGYK